MINIQNLKLKDLVPFEGSPFEFREDEGFLQLYDSISENGVISPIVVCEKNGQYEIVSGYRRVEACKRLNIDVISAIVKDLTREQAIVMHVDSNFQRDEILPSEKAFGYKMRLDAIKKQGFRSDLTSDQPGRKLESAEIVANETDDSKTQVRRYIRLTFLIPEILKLVDEERIAFTPAVALSYLSPEEQHMIYKFYNEMEATPSYSQAVELKNLSSEGKLNEGVVTEIMSREKPNQIEYFKMPMEILQRIAPKIKEKDFEKFVTKACEHYYRVLQRQKDRDAR